MKLRIDGEIIATFATADQMQEFAKEEGIDLAAANATVELSPRELKKHIRAEIRQSAGDTESLLGTTADGAQLAVYGLAVLVSKLAVAQSLADVREAALPFAQLSADFLAKVESGEVTLPFMVKGIEAVVADIETRATAVSAALKSAQKGA